VKYRSTSALLCLLCLGIGGCASNAADDGDADAYDPFESFNRKMYRFNEVLDTAALKPLAKGYRRVTPKPVRRGFANVFANFTTPRSALNNFLQGKPKRGFNELGRFLFNSTLGIGGIFDVASAGGMETYDESFGETLAVWGLPEGPYLILPVFGSRSLLDASAFPVDWYTDLNPHLKTSVRDKLYFFRLMDSRVRLLSAETFIEKSNDPYIALRESYRQNRQFKIFDGDPPQDEELMDEDMFDEFFEDDVSE
jgi:phospholipid-binding lipoprotein MlaA